MTDYIKWRGDLTFDESPFNDVDNLILSHISYTDLDGIVPDPGTKDTILLKDAAEAFFDINDEDELSKSKSFIASAPFILRQAAGTKRFGEIELSNYVNHVNVDKEKQFAALHARIGKNLHFIVFRGTDDTLIGWKEDFNMCVLRPVPSQEESVEYLNKTAGNLCGKIILGGHSKGGNLAIYSAVNANKRVRKKILSIYNNDGPGFDKKMLKSQSYQEIKPLIKSFVPEFSFVGMLLEHDDDYTVVKSSQTALMQHDAVSWQVMGAEFVTADSLSKASVRLNRIILKWLSKIENEKKSELVDTLFMIISASGAENLSDIGTEKLKNVASMIKTISHLDRETKRLLIELIHSLRVEIGGELWNQ